MSIDWSTFPRAPLRSTPGLTSGTLSNKRFRSKQEKTYVAPKGAWSLSNTTQGLTTPTCAKAAQVGVVRPGLLYFTPFGGWIDQDYAVCNSLSEQYCPKGPFFHRCLDYSNHKQSNCKTL